MKKNIKYLLWSIPVLLGLAFAGQMARTAGTDYWTIVGYGAYAGQDLIGLNNTPQFYITDGAGTNVFTVNTSGNVSASGTLTQTGATTLTGTLTTASNHAVGDGTVASTSTSLGTYHTAYLSANSAACYQGSLLMSTTPATGQGLTVMVSTYAHTSEWVGFAAAAASAGSTVNVYVDGFVMARATGTINAGDIVYSTDTVNGSVYAPANDATVTETELNTLKRAARSPIGVFTGNSADSSDTLIQIRLN